VPPTVTAQTATSIGNITATLGATVSNGGDSSITARGTVWGLSANQTSNALAEGGTITGIFSQARTNLPAGTKIYYRGYATNSAGTGYSPDGSFYTEPSTQASGVSFSSVGPSAMTVNWTRGNGDGVIVLMKQSAEVNSDPVDGTYSGYTANSTFGSGSQIGSGNYVVYKGTGTSVTVSGLTSNTNYYITAYEFKGTVDTSGVNQGTNYKLLPLTGNQATSHGGTFYYTGSVQTLTIPAGAKNLQFTVKGAGGGGGRADGVGNQQNGQNGHSVVMSYAVSDITLRIYVGAGGAGSLGTSGSPGGFGFNSGGVGGGGEYQSDEDGDCEEWAYGGAGGGGSSAILLDSNGTVLTEAAGGNGGRSSDRNGSCYYVSGGSGGGGGGLDNPSATNPTGGGTGGLAGGSPSLGGNGVVVITYE
jgi:hypothetical protein